METSSYKNKTRVHVSLRTYLFLGDFQGFQVVTDHAELFFKLDDFAEIKKSET